MEKISHTTQTNLHLEEERGRDGQHGKPTSSDLFAVFVFFFLSCLVLFSQQINFDYSSKSGLIVPDSVSLSWTLQDLWSHDRLFDSKTGYWALAGLYGWTWLVHPSLCFVVNCLLMLANVAVFRRSIIVRLGAPPWSALGLLANPYLILAMPGPNKEIPLLLMTLLIADAIFRPRPRRLLAIALCIPVYLLRDGYGLILLSWLGISWMVARHHRIVPIMFLSFATGVAAFWTSLSTLVPAMQRNKAIYNDIFKNQEAIGSVAANFALDPFDPLGGVVLFLLRLVYNLVSMALFPVFLTADGRFYWIGLAYWVFGLMILMSLMGSFWKLLSMSGVGGVQFAASLVLCVWFMVSLSLFVQPRYLMPALPIAFGVLATLPPLSRGCCMSLAIALSLTVIFTYALQGRFLYSATPEVLRLPAYLVGTSPPEAR